MSVLEDKEKIIALIVSDRVNDCDNNVFEFHCCFNCVGHTKRFTDNNVQYLQLLFTK